MGSSWTPAVAIPTLVGSLLSFTATSTVILLWVLTNGNKRSFRYALVMILAFAECINSLNNSISGLYVVLYQRDVPQGLVCNMNGWVGQVSVQAADFSILAIAVVTLLALRFKASILYAPFQRKVAICLAVWLVPLTTATTALALDKFRPASGNWCWIDASPVYLRYVLGHGWRYGILIACFVIYIFVFYGIHQRLKRRNKVQRAYSFYLGDGTNAETRAHVQALNRTLMDGEKNTGETNWKIMQSLGLDSKVSLSPASTYTGSLKSFTSTSSDNNKPAYAHKAHSRDAGTSEDLEKYLGRPKVRMVQSSELDRELWKMYLLNLYPLTYVLLWLPGIANRLVEASGHHLEWLAILQSSTQYTGFVNAMVYGFREHRFLLGRRGRR